MNFQQSASNYAARTVTKTVGLATGLALGVPGMLFSKGSMGDKVTQTIASNVVEPIGNVVKKKYHCNSCGRDFTVD